MTDSKPSLLGPYRVLDLTGEEALIAGKILGDLGADVVKIEPPGGDRARARGPFLGGIPGPERSLSWMVFNSSKRGITLDLGSVDGRALFERLAAAADIVIESFPAGHLERIGVDVTAIRTASPGLVWVSVIAFQREGPWADYRISDLVAMALSGQVLQTGDPDRPPVRTTAPQAYLWAGMQAAAGALTAHRHRLRTGKGQRVEVSVHEAAMWTGTPERHRWELNREFRPRGGRFPVSKTLEVRNVWRCADGYVAFRPYSGKGFGRRTQLIVDWMAEEGAAGELAGVTWEELDIFSVSQARMDRWEALFDAFFARRTKSELYEEGTRRRGCLIFPVFDAADICNDPQLAARGFFTPMEHPHLGTTLAYPGSPVRTNGPTVGVRRRAPRIGEHNDEIYRNELGLSADALRRLAHEGIV